MANLPPVIPHFLASVFGRKVPHIPWLIAQCRPRNMLCVVSVDRESCTGGLPNTGRLFATNCEMSSPERTHVEATKCLINLGFSSGLRRASPKCRVKRSTPDPGRIQQERRALNWSRALNDFHIR